MADMKVSVAAANAYYYPDVVVSCAAKDRAPDFPSDYLQAPSLIVEVMSPSTATTDRRDVDGWLHQTATAGEHLYLQSVDLTLAAADIYEDADVPAEWPDCSEG